MYTIDQMKILIADTAGDTKRVLKKIFGDEGYECVFIENSKEIIDKVYSDLPDIIILDIKLSQPTGLKILERLKSAPSTRDIPVILIATRKAQRTLKKGYELGAYDYVSKPYFREEVLARIGNIIYIREKMKELDMLIVRDYLTGLYNRKFFMERLQEELSWSTKYKEPFSIIMLDIDHFKKINDTYGHSCGDEILKQLAHVLLSVLKPQDLVARYGGEEFIILSSNTDSDNAMLIAENLRTSVQNGHFSCGNDKIKLPVSISVGVTTLAESIGQSLDDLLWQADSALYTAKREGRNRVVIYNR